MARSTKPVWILCPRCELNYIKKADHYCNVCKKEMKLIQASDDDIDDLELCPICKINFVQSDQEICDSCREELGINNSEEAEDKEIDDWHRYIADDDDEEDDDETDSNTSIYDQDELEDTSGVDEEFDFAEDIDKDFDDEDDDDDDEEDEDEEDNEDDEDLEDIDDDDDE